METTARHAGPQGALRWVCLGAACLLLAFCDALSNAVGHTALVAGALNDLGLPVNGKLLFEVGLLAVSVACAALPRFLDRYRFLLAFVPLALLWAGIGLGMAASVAHAVPASFDPAAVVLFGAGFIGLKFFASYALALLYDFSAFLLCVAGSKVVKTALGAPLWLGDSAAQLAMVLCCAAGCAVCAVVLFRLWPANGPSGDAPIVRQGISFNVLVGQAVLASAVLASVQPFTYFGTYGSLPLHDWAAYGVFLLGTLLIPVATWFVFLRDPGSEKSFRTAFLLFLAAVFFVSAQSNQTWTLSSEFSAGLLTLFEMFGQVLYWAAVSSACWLARDRMLAVIGIVMAVFSAVSIFWIVLLSQASQVVSLAVTVAAYGLSLASLKLLPYISTMKRSEKAALSDDLLARIAQDHGLSPRETDVFMLLARGRSRSVIQEELSISEGTVKTHTSRIYQKFGVDGKQGLLSEVLREAQG